MFKGRLLSMIILFFAALATLAPLAFLAGLDRGRGSMSAQAAELPQNDTNRRAYATTRNNHSTAGTICDDESLFGKTIARIFCGAAAPDETPTRTSGETVRARSQVLSNSVVASIADMNDPLPGEPLGLAVAPDGETLDIEAPAGSTAESAKLGSPSVPGGAGIPASLAPFALPGQGPGAPSAPPPTSPPPAGTPPAATPPPTAGPPPTPTEPPVIVTPLPGAIALFSSGLAFIVTIARRRRRKGSTD